MFWKKYIKDRGGKMVFCIVFISNTGESDAKFHLDLRLLPPLLFTLPCITNKKANAHQPKNKEGREGRKKKEF